MVAFLLGSLSTVVGDEKLTSREDLIGLLFFYVQSDENTLPKVNKVTTGYFLLFFFNLESLLSAL